MTASAADWRCWAMESAMRRRADVVPDVEVVGAMVSGGMVESGLTTSLGEFRGGKVCEDVADVTGVLAVEDMAELGAGIARFSRREMKKAAIENQQRIPVLYQWSSIYLMNTAAQDKERTIIEQELISSVYL